MPEFKVPVKARRKYVRLSLPEDRGFMRSVRATTWWIAVGVTALACAATLLLPAPATPAPRAGRVYMVSLSGKVPLGDFVGSPKFDNGVFTWRDKKGAEYRTVAPVIFETR